jgi:murein DD-endopeptidase MepM/ murein hydrolase activator NlpD
VLPAVAHGIGDKTPVVCVACGAVVDRLRDPARVESGRVVHVCRACAGLSAEGEGGGGESRRNARARALSQSACARCGSHVPLYEARPVQSGDGRIALACVACAEGHEQPGEACPEVLEPQAGARIGASARASAFAYVRRHAAALAALAVAVLLAVLQVRAQTPPRSAAADSLRATAAALPGGLLAGHGQEDPDSSSPGPGDAAAGVPESSGDHAGPGDDAHGEHQDDWLQGIDTSVLDDSGELPPTIEDLLERSEPLEERLPTLVDWVFPVLGSSEPFPLKPTRQFGADRDGRGSPECGRGHCGVDLDGPRGTPVVAVAWGVVKRIERRGNRSSGKYVSIEHPDSVFTAYMHLDDIAENLELGAEVEPGDVLGTLGRTGIRHSAPHLHFSLAVPSGTRLVHIDPAPYLERAERTRAR